ncbi:hypothetical protein GCM10010967_59390 [Dyadobacter beijingensis]|uniref:Uncharacterized protein n=1 Tax=Dyadobacter beijingensis TaxID=365489 RepID=A0ABQ2IMQ2_9BACT|nr:hypothetical protein GCM10010967_59390 [Dyadobacter beijingensis]
MIRVFAVPKSIAISLVKKSNNPIYNVKNFAHFDFRMAKLQIINHKQRHLKNFGMWYPKGVKLVAKQLSDGVKSWNL